MRIIPVYLPQFHRTPENDKWWGEGFTEWTNVKKAKPLYVGHHQPRIPLNNNYYDLSDIDTLRWQCNLAKQYGIYGFCIYHYWFNGHLLLEKPLEMLRANPDIEINYCISWANHDWTDGWKSSNKTPQILISHNFNDEKDWVDHFNYLSKYFDDPRYISENNKPFMVIYAPNLIPKLNKMLKLWDKMAKTLGYDGLTYIFQSAASNFDLSWDRSRFMYGVEMNPGYANTFFQEKKNWGYFPKLMKYTREFKRLFHIKRSLLPKKKIKDVAKGNYDTTWQKILKLTHPNKGPVMIPCAFTDWDNTPRHQMRGFAYEGVNVDKFHQYFSDLVNKTKKEYATDMIFVFAWNEWAEGGYLEPDELYGYGFLESIKEVLSKNKE